MLDVVDRRRHAALRLGEHAAGHLIRRQARIRPDDGDDRNFNVREDIDRRAHRRQWPDDHDDQGQHHEGVWPPQSNADNPDHAVSAFPEYRP